MDKSKIARQKIDRSPQISSAAAEDDSVIMSKIRSIIGRGNNAEVKGKKDGSLTCPLPGKIDTKKHTKVE